MSKFTIFGKKKLSKHRQFEDDQMVNFMDGISYKVNPLSTLKLVAGSSIFGEPSYYRNSHDAQKYIDKVLPWGFAFNFEDDSTSTDVFVKVVDEALSFDFKGTLDLAKELRHDYFMRLNPSLILVRAAMHKDRALFNALNGDYLRNIGKSLILRPDDITNQFELFMFFNKTKKGLPSILKRIWKDKLESFTAYQINKYKSSSIIDLVRISHANSELIDELMQTGMVAVKTDEKTWENLRSEGHTWEAILDMTYVPHMALLRNLRNIFQKPQSQSVPLREKLVAKVKGLVKSENTESQVFLSKVLTQLKNGVKGGKQFPFRYYSAYNEISKAEVFHQKEILNALEECIDASIENFPKLTGKTICLSDNSGSAWGTIPSSYGSVTVATIANLSSIITAVQSDEGSVGVFGDKLNIQPVSAKYKVLAQLKETDERGKKQGQATENGIWLFFEEAIKKKVWYDNIFIYSDMQAGRGKLYGKNAKEYAKYVTNDRYIDVLQLVQDYREHVNSKVNIFSVQVAGYRNSVVPENLYRTSILTGWTGKEVVFANYMKSVWDNVEDEDNTEV